MKIGFKIALLSFHLQKKVSNVQFFMCSRNITYKNHINISSFSAFFSLVTYSPPPDFPHWYLNFFLNFFFFSFLMSSVIFQFLFCAPSVFYPILMYLKIHRGPGFWLMAFRHQNPWKKDFSIAKCSHNSWISIPNSTHRYSLHSSLCWWMSLLTDFLFVGWKRWYYIQNLDDPSF